MVGHRCGNDLGRLRSAIASGIPAVEADVHLFRGRLEVRHLKTLGPIPVLWDTWYVTRPRPGRLLLDDVLAACDPTVELMLDLKGPRRAIALLVLDALRPDRGLLRLTVCGRHPRVLSAFQDDPDVRVVHSVGSRRRLRSFLRGRDVVDSVAVHARLLDAPTVAALRRRAGRVLVWPVTTPAEAARLGDWGVHGLITERLELAPSGSPAA